MSEEDKKPHLCTMCHMAFMTIEELKNHVLFEHNDGNTEKFDELSTEFLGVNGVVNKVEQCDDSECVLKSEEVSLEMDAMSTTDEINSENHAKFEPDEENINFTSYDKVYFHDQNLLDDLPQHVQNALLQCEVCRIIFTSTKALEEHMVTHADSGEFIQHIKEEKDHPVVTGSCYINMFAACRKESAPAVANFSEDEVSCEEDDDDYEEEDDNDDDDDYEEEAQEEELVQEEVEESVSEEGEKETSVETCAVEEREKGKEKPSGSKQVIECKICKLVFNRKLELANHMSVHRSKQEKEQQVIKCNRCDKTFKNKYKLKLHSLEHKDGKKIQKCTKCDKSFTTNARYKKHLAAHEKSDGKSKKKLQCSVCDKEFATGNHLKQHMMIHTGFRPYQCSHCGKGFIKRADLLRHETTHSEIKPYLCSLCAKGFGTSCQLKFHMMRHTGETPFTCTTCGKGFIAQKYLRIHERLHTGKKPFLCNLCGRGLSSRKRLKAHIMLHTGEKAFPCTQCDKSYTSKHHLEKHMIVHREGPYICTICNRECRGKGNLERHMKSCSGETRHLLEKYKDVECPICNRKFKKYNLKQHVRIHTGEKPFVCPKCNKAYKRNYLLEEHMRSHSGEKPFTCSICNKAFARKLNMKVHIRTHTGEKPLPPRSRSHEVTTVQEIQERQAVMQGMTLNVRSPELPHDFRLSAGTAHKDQGYSTTSTPSPPEQQAL